MNTEGYVVTCNKCSSTNIKFDYQKTKINIENKKTSTPVKCLDCNNEITIEK